jgi:hypothetical protein
MNPFTQFLRQWSHDDYLDEFVTYWDRLERLTIQIYRRKISTEAAQPEFDIVWPWLRVSYGRWQTELSPYWQQSKAAGQPAQTDPFALLLAKQSPADILGDWAAMQHLPAAREALNQFILNRAQ